MDDCGFGYSTTRTDDAVGVLFNAVVGVAGLAQTLLVASLSGEAGGVRCC